MTRLAGRPFRTVAVHGPRGVSWPGSSDLSSAVNPVWPRADLARLLTDLLHAYQAELSSLLALWQQADALLVQRFDALLSMGNGALKKDMAWLSAL